MRTEGRTAVYDEDFGVKAYRLVGAVQPFPNHFHDYYVIGLMESGRRMLSCGNAKQTVSTGDVLLFNPGDCHACAQSDEGTLDYRGLSISQEVMLDLAEETTGRCDLPSFSRNVVTNTEVSHRLCALHQQVMRGSREFEKEEGLLLLVSQLVQRYGQFSENRVPECREEVERACAFLDEHHAEHIHLEDVCRYAGLSKSSLLRAFARSKGITPYCYLENIRVAKAMRLLEEGVPPAQAALRTGFFDQSHFTTCFRRFTGLTPGMYRDLFPHKLVEDAPHGE